MARRTWGGRERCSGGLGGGGEWWWRRAGSRAASDGGTRGAPVLHAEAMAVTVGLHAATADGTDRADSDGGVALPVGPSPAAEKSSPGPGLAGGREGAWRRRDLGGGGEVQGSGEGPVAVVERSSPGWVSPAAERSRGAARTLMAVESSSQA